MKALTIILAMIHFDLIFKFSSKKLRSIQEK